MFSGAMDLEAEIRMVLTAAGRTAQRRYVDLQMAVEPRLVAQGDVAPFRTCLRELVAGAIERAESGVLVTAMRRGQRVDIEVLDDGIARSNASRFGDGAATSPAHTLPIGATLATDFQSDRGTKSVIGLPCPERLPASIGDTLAETVDPDGY